MKIEPFTDTVDSELWDLLLLADPNEAAVREYLSSSEIVVAIEGGIKIGVAVLSHQGEEFELKNIAVHPDYQDRGIAKALIAEMKSRAKLQQASCLLVGTGNSSLNQLALYQKCGFRIVGVEPDYFSHYRPTIFESGIQCRDLILLKARL